MENVIKVLGFVSFAAITSLFRGFVFQKLWLWFVIPQFGLAALPLTVAMGIMLVASFAVSASQTTSKSPTEAFVYSLSQAGCVLLIGWLITLFM